MAGGAGGAVRTLDDVMVEGEVALATLKDLHGIVMEAIDLAGERDRLGELGSNDLARAVQTTARRRFLRIRREMTA